MAIHIQGYSSIKIQNLVSKNIIMTTDELLKCTTLELYESYIKSKFGVDNIITDNISNSTFSYNNLYGPGIRSGSGNSSIVFVSKIKKKPKYISYKFVDISSINSYVYFILNFSSNNGGTYDEVFDYRLTQKQKYTYIIDNGNNSKTFKKINDVFILEGTINFDTDLPNCFSKDTGEWLFYLESPKSANNSSRNPIYISRFEIIF